MFKWAGIVVLILHAFIHLLGLDARQNTHGRELTGIIWYIPFALFLATALGIAFDKDWWWIIALLAMVLSQILIVNHWHESKAGTLVNILISVFVIIAIGQWNFRIKVRKEITNLFFFSASEKRTFRDRMPVVNNLPGPVSNWLIQSGAFFKEPTHFVHLQQQGVMRTTPTESWLPLKAEQYFTVDKPAFIWNAKVKAAGPLYIVARDKYENGKGNMLIRFLSLVSMSNAKGKEIDQGSLVRFLAEIIWFPSAALNPYIKWKAVNSQSAIAVMSYNGVTAQGLFTFNDRGEVMAFDSERYMENKDNYTLEPWHITNLKFEERNGIRIPVESEITWKLKEGDFTWCKLQVTDIEYNEFVGE